MTLLSQFDFKGNQQQAVTDPSPLIAVTAGAGAGKTLSLVGRYLYLLEQGCPIRSILAITFTEKAAREMRSRIRKALFSLPPEERVGVREIDAARIGTIHSLCAEILRSHPVEAGLDPQFNILEEGLASALQAEAVESALAWAATDQHTAALFGLFKENELRQILNALIARRLDVKPLYPVATAGMGERGEKEIRDALRTAFSLSLNSHLATHLDSRPWLDSLSVLASHRSSSPEDKLELARQAVLAAWDKIRSARAAQKWDDILTSLADLRKSISTQGQKANWADIETVREAMKTLREIYDSHLHFLAEKSRFSLDEQVADSLPAVYRLFDQALREYQTRKDERHALDFDDLEGITTRLLAEHPDLRARLQSELCAVLVDEFQDTNDRQRQIVYALTGFSPPTAEGAGVRADSPLPLGEGPGVRADSPLPLREGPGVRADSPLPLGEGPGVRADSPLPLRDGPGVRASVALFLVGDSKQGIYKFRGADITVFRQVQADIRAAGGQLIDLDLTFRAHAPLLETLNSLLAPILGNTNDPARPYLVPFAPLKAHRQNPERDTIQPPFVEFHLGLGENAEEGRQSAAHALAKRLRELHQTEGFTWGDMALLFRSSTAFPVYESALEAQGIPFITVAGRGFYDRPEIRDLLNALAAIADPTDDLALLGFLRSPAFAIPDAKIYRLRYPGNSTSPVKLFDSLKEQVHTYTAPQVETHNTLTSSPNPYLVPFAVLQELHSLSGRTSAAHILKRFLDLTNYRAILSAVPNGARLVRNVDKLLADAHRSRLVSLTDFLAYAQSLRDVSFREGEAPADPASAGAVQLMTVHKAKGLEFPLTVIADASYSHRGESAKIQLTDSLLLDLRDEEFHPTAWQLAARHETELDDAEDRRLLYVAATRAKEKLLISGYVKQKRDGLSLTGWLSHFPFLNDLTPDRPLLSDGISASIYSSTPATASDSPQPASTSPAAPPLPERYSEGLPPSSFVRLPEEGKWEEGEGHPPLPLGAPLTAAGGPEVRADLLAPIASPPPLTDDKTRAREAEPPQRIWRIISLAKHPHPPAWLVGRLVHEAIRRWRFDDLDNFLKPFALEAGLTDEAQISAAIGEARQMLERLRAHPLFEELDTAKRHHEIPYYLPNERGLIDLLYRVKENWVIIDFKTDDVRSDEEARAAISRNGYDRQLERYARAINDQLKVQAKTQLVFLNVNGKVKIYEL